MQRLSGLDATFLYLETPTMHMHVGLVAVLDPKVTGQPYDHARVTAIVEREARRQPRFHRRLVEVPFHLDHPSWIDDPHFDLIHHLRRTTCPQPGGTRELADLAGRILSTPLDRSRPLWELWVAEGLEGGRFALIAKVHHAIADGLTGASLLTSLFSLTPEAPTRPSTPPPAPEKAPEVIPSNGDLVREALFTRWKRPQEMARLYKSTQKALQNIVERRQSGAHRVGASVFDAPRTHWNAPLSAQRTVASARVPVADVKLVRKAFSVTPNDVVLAICAGALRRYLEARGELPLAPLVAACPVATRRKSKEGSNHVSALFTSLATNLEDPKERLLAIRTITRGAKEEHHAFGADMAAHWAEVMSPGIFSMAARLYSRYRVSDLHRPLYNVAISNVPGPPVSVYFAGAKLMASYPLGPLLDGVGLNITVMSYAEHVDFGLVAAPNVLPDIWTLAALIPEAAQELSAQAKQEGPRVRKSAEE
jgi:diacylglycerol O-acyltransferase